MATWKITGDNGRVFTIDAPDTVPEADVIEFTAANADTWANGGRYRMSVATDAPAAPAAGKTVNEKADIAVKYLNEQLDALKAERDQITPRNELEPSVNEGTHDLDTQIGDLTAKRDSLMLGDTGATVGGVGGALGGAALGATIGAVAGPPGMVIGGALGSILGGAAGTAAGTHLWDIPEARGARDISDAEAAQLIRRRAIESLVWDGAFVLVLGPGGKLIGKMANGQKFGPALKASAKESLGWDQLANIKKDQLAKVVEQRAAAAKPGITSQASDALGVPSRVTPAQLVGDIADKSGGRVPTTGEMSGMVAGGERFVRSQSPMPFMQNDQILADTADRIRKEALGALDQAGAHDRIGFGNAVRDVVSSADAALKRVTGPVFDRAAQENVRVDMRPVRDAIDKLLFRDVESAQSLLRTDRGYFEALKKSLTEEPWMSMQGSQDFVSGQKAFLRETRPDGSKPAEFVQKALGQIVADADTAFLAAAGKADPKLGRDLRKARDLYRSTMDELRSDSLVKVLREAKTPEDAMQVFTVPGTVTEIRELRQALDRALSGAGARGPAGYAARPKLATELSKQKIRDERARIDAGLVKGFIEQNTRSLTDLEAKFTDPKFRDTIKELLLGEGVVNPKLGQKVLDELDRTMGVIKLIRPELAPQAGRIVVPGISGSVSATTAGAMATGSPATAAPLVFFSLGMTRLIGNAASKAMTTGNTGALRTIQRAGMLAKVAGKNAAAAEALHGALRDLDEWDRENGGAGIIEAVQ